MRIEYHRNLLRDHVRNSAFDRALAEVVRPGESVVADIGAGTGLIGFMALRHGACRVYAYENASVLAVAEEIAKANRIRHWEPIPGHSTEVLDPPRVDIVVSETLGNYAFEEDILTTLDDARRRHLKPGGVMIPRAVEQFVCPVVSDRHWRELAVWDEVGPALTMQLDLGAAKSMSFNNIYVRWLEPADLLEAGVAARRWDRADLTRGNRSTRRGEAEWSLSSAADVYGLALWWRAELTAGVSLSTSPLEPRTHWEQLFLPASRPIALGPGDGLTARLRSSTSAQTGTDVAWTLQHRSADGKTIAKQAMSLDKGYML